MSVELRRKTIQAVGHLGVGGALNKIISFGTTLLLARMLSPADYGLVALAMVVINFMAFFNEFGIGSSVLQRKELVPAEVNGCFAIALLSSSVLFIGMVLASDVIARFFGNPTLGPMISVLSAGFILGAFGTIPNAYLRRELQFKAVAGISFLAVVCQSVTALVLAKTGHGVWSLVWGSLVYGSIVSIGAFVLSPWRPSGPYGVRAASSLVMYGIHITKSRIFWYLYMNADKMIVGKLLGNRALGVYDMAFSIASMPTGQITSLVINVSASLFAKLQSELDKLSAAVLKMTKGIAYLTYPALIGMLVTSRELIMVVLGDKWGDVLIPFGALCLMGLIKSVDPLLSQVLISTGHAKKLSNYTALCCVVMSVALAVGALAGGILGVSIAWVVCYPLLSIKLLRDTCRVTGMSMLDYYKTIGSVLIGAVVMGAVVLGVRELGLIAHVPTLWLLVIEVATGVVAYLLWLCYGDRHALNDIRLMMEDAGFATSRLDRWPFVRGAKPKSS